MSLTDLFQFEDLQSVLLNFLTTLEINLPIIALNLVCCRFHLIIQTLIKTKFQHLSKPTKYKLCAQAALSDNIELLKWTRPLGFHWNEITCENAASNGHFEVLKWAHENGCAWNKCTCSHAALNGHLDVLQWAHQNGCPLE
jgi:hypothetical protein